MVRRVELVAKKDGDYTIYVFKNLDVYEYIMCTRLPNWQTVEVEIGDKGFVEYEIVNAGDTYFSSSLGEFKRSVYSNVYFINFVHENKNTKDKIII